MYDRIHLSAVLMEELIRVKRKKVVKSKVRDSVFTCLFSDLKYVARLYRDLHPECKDITEDDIEIETLQTVLINTLYNDLGFIVKGDKEDKLLILVEAQSTWNRHMPLRMLGYMVETYRRYMERKKIDINRDVKIKLPEPELYVIFTGERKNVPDVVSLQDVYWKKKVPIELEVKVIHEANNKTIQGEYIGFCNVVSEQKKLTEERDMNFLEKVISICIERGYLVDFLSEKKEEVIDMTRNLFDEEKLLKIHIDACIRDAVKESEDKIQKAKEAEEKAKKEAKEAKEKAEKEAKEKIVDMSVSLVKKKAISIEEAAKMCEMSIEEFESILKNG